MRTLRFTSKQLKALAGFASTDVVRPGINGVAIIETPGHVPMLSATDGYRLMVYMPASVGWSAALEFAKGVTPVVDGERAHPTEPKLIRSASLNQAIAAAGAKGMIELTWSDRGYELVVEKPGVDDLVITGAFDEAQFPRMTSLWPGLASAGANHAVGFNPKYLASCATLVDAMPAGVDQPWQFLGGDSPLKPHVGYGTSDHVAGRWTVLTLVMPVRCEGYRKDDDGSMLAIAAHTVQAAADAKGEPLAAGTVAS